VSLGSLGDFWNGAAFKPSDWGDVGTPIIRIQNLNDPSKHMHRTKRVVDARLLVTAGDLLVSWSATLDAFTWIREEAWLNQHISKVVPDSNVVDHKYMLFLLKNEIENLKKTEHLHGSTMMHINRGPFLAHLVPVPPITTQKCVAQTIDELFAEIDDGEAALARARSDLATWRKALLKAAVTGELTADWRAANPPTETGAALLARILADRRTRWLADPRNKAKVYVEPAGPDTSNFRVLPEGWTWASLGQLCSVITSGSRAWSSYYGRGQGTFIMAQNVRPGRYDGRFHQPVDPPEGDVERIRTAVARDDLLLTIVGANTGDLCRFDRNPDNHYVCQSVALLRLQDCSLASIVEAFFANDFGKKLQMEEMIYGAGRPHLSFDQIKLLAVPVPPSAEREQITQALQAIMSEVDAVLTDVPEPETLSATLRQSILAAAFRGDLVA